MNNKLNISFSILGIIAAILTFITGIIGCWNLQKKENVKKHATKAELIFRAIVGGSVMCGPIILSHLDLGILSGLFSVFPGLFLSTMVLLWFTHGFTIPSGFYLFFIFVFQIHNTRIHIHIHIQIHTHRCSSNINVGCGLY